MVVQLTQQQWLDLALLLSNLASFLVESVVESASRAGLRRTAGLVLASLRKANKSFARSSGCRGFAGGLHVNVFQAAYLSVLHCL